LLWRHTQQGGKDNSTKGVCQPTCSQGVCQRTCSRVSTRHSAHCGACDAFHDALRAARRKLLLLYAAQYDPLVVCSVCLSVYYWRPTATPWPPPPQHDQLFDGVTVTERVIESRSAVAVHEAHSCLSQPRNTAHGNNRQKREKNLTSQPAQRMAGSGN